MVLWMMVIKIKKINEIHELFHPLFNLIQWLGITDIQETCVDQFVSSILKLSRVSFLAKPEGDMNLHGNHEM